MTNIVIEGADYQDSEAVMISSGFPLNSGGTYVFSTGRTFNRGRQWENNASAAYATIPFPGGSEVYLGMHVSYNEEWVITNGEYDGTFQAGGVQLFSIRESAQTVPHLKLYLTRNRGLRVLRGTNTDLAGTTGRTDGGVIDDLMMDYIEFYAKINATTGAFEVKVNDVTVMSATGIDTTSTSAVGVTIDDVLIYHRNVANSITSNDHEIDNLYINDHNGASPFNGFLGETEIITLFPDGDGFQSDFTATGAGTTNSDRVDDKVPPDDDTTYVESATIGHIDSYTMENLPYTADTIYGIQINCRAKTDDGSAKTARQRIRSNASDFLGTNFSVQSTYTGDRALCLVDPNTAAAWTSAAVDAMQVGHEVIA